MESSQESPIDPLVEEELMQDFSSRLPPHSVVIPSSQDDDVIESSQEFPVDPEQLQDLLEDPDSLVHPADHRGLFAKKKASVQQSKTDAPTSKKRKRVSAPTGVAGDAAQPGAAGVRCSPAPDAPRPKNITGVTCRRMLQRGSEFYQMKRDKEIL